MQPIIEDKNLSIVQAFAPTERSSEEVYNDIKGAHDLADDKIIVMGDVNERIRRPKKEENLVMGNYSYGERNERGEKLIDYALEYNLKIINTFSTKKQNKKWNRGYYLIKLQRTK